MTFDEAFEVLLRHEGGYSDHPDDPGGKTKFGITEEVAREHGYLGEMASLPVAFAKRIYRKAYWDAVMADEMPEAIRYPLFDAAVNSGPSKAVTWLQRALGIADDGDLGPMTLAAVKADDPYKVAQAMVGERLRFMAKLSTWPTFGRGWARRVASILVDG